jgi:hypothetical protein
MGGGMDVDSGGGASTLGAGDGEHLRVGDGQSDRLLASARWKRKRKRDAIEPSSVGDNGSRIRTLPTRH